MNETDIVLIADEVQTDAASSLPAGAADEVSADVSADVAPVLQIDANSQASADTTAVLPADSAFVSGTLMLPHESTRLAADFDNARGNCIVDILIVIFIIAAMLSVRRLINLIPSLVGCLLRWKESVNLENSMKLQRDRNVMTIVVLFPFCLMAARYSLYSPDFMAGMTDVAAIAVTAGVFCGFIAVKEAAYYLRKPKRSDSNAYKIAHRTSYTFFIIIALILLAICGAMSFAGCSDADVKSVLLYVTAALYLLYIWRKGQILVNYCSGFSAFLYLCRLEILPTCLLVASALLL